MRAGWIVSAIGHVGAVMMSLLAWEASSTPPPMVGSVVPVEIVTIAPESNVRALALPEEETSPAPAAAEEAQQDQPEPAPTPAAEQQRPRERRSSEFDLAAISGMLDKQRRASQRRVDGETADRNQQGAGAGTADVASLQDRIRALTRAHMRQCWRTPTDLPNPERLVITVAWELDRNGHLRGQPRVTSPANYNFDPIMRTAANQALRAVRECDRPYPYPNDSVVGERYDLWRYGDFTFRPE